MARERKAVPRRFGSVDESMMSKKMSALWLFTGASLKKKKRKEKKIK